MDIFRGSLHSNYKGKTIPGVSNTLHYLVDKGLKDLMVSLIVALRSLSITRFLPSVGRGTLYLALPSLMTASSLSYL